MNNVKAVIESLLLASEEPLTVERIKGVLEIVDAGEIRNALTRLAQEYDEQTRGFCLREVAGGYQLRTRPEYGQWVRRVRQSRPARLSRAALETLAIIAYKQPAMRTDIEHLRGVDCGGILRTLLEHELIRVMGRQDLPGRPMVYGTTKRFLEMFGLKDLKDLPTLKDLQELGEPWPNDSMSSSPELELPLEDKPSV